MIKIDSLEGCDEVPLRLPEASVFSGASTKCFMYIFLHFDLKVFTFLEATIGSLSLVIIGPMTVLK